MRYLLAVIAVLAAVSVAGANDMFTLNGIDPPPQPKPAATAPLLFQDCPNGLCPPVRTVVFPVRQPRLLFQSSRIVQRTVAPVPVVATPVVVQSAPVVAWSDQVVVSGSSTGVRTYGSTGTSYFRTTSNGSTGGQTVYRQTTRTRTRYIPANASSGNNRIRLFPRIRAMRNSGVRMRAFSSGYVYPPAGQSIAWHLRNDHGINTAGMSYGQMMSLHTQLH